MLFAWSLRVPAPGDPSHDPVTADELRCGGTACRLVVKQDVGRDAVEVLTGEGTGRIRTTGASGRTIFELAIAGSGAAVDERSLQCVDAEVAVCLVRGLSGDEMHGEVLVRRSGWSRVQASYVASGGYLGLDDVDDDGVADVVAVQRSCKPGTDCARRFAQVFSTTDAKAGLGCTTVVAEPELLPGWPVVAPSPAQLRPCGS
jgi:hypothetical protein